MNSHPSTRGLIFGTIVLAVGLLVYFAIQTFSPTATKRRFCAKWEKLLSEVQSPADLRNRVSAKEWSFVLVKTFKDGSWVIARGDSTPGGDLFNATLLRESGGRLLLTEYHFSGFEGLEEYLSTTPGDTSKVFMNNFAERYHATDLSLGRSAYRQP